MSAKLEPTWRVVSKRMEIGHSFLITSLHHLIIALVELSEVRIGLEPGSSVQRKMFPAVTKKFRKCARKR